jgi:hypothetical protein
MSEQIIITKRGNYGRVQVTLPMQVKQSMLDWQKKSGMGKAEFLRVALMIGAAQLANDVQAKRKDEGYFSDGDPSLVNLPART